MAKLNFSFLVGRQAERIVLAALLLASNLVCASAEANAQGQGEEQCNVYLAKSSLKGHTGFGVYTTRDIARGQPILSGPPGTPDGPTVAVVDSTRNIPPELVPANHQWHNTWGHYWWGRGVPDHVAYESDEGDSVDYQLTFGALPNHQCVLQSIDYVFPDSPYDDSLLNRYTDPGAGAFSYHRGRVFQATRDITAGSELFLSYGYCEKISPWAQGRDDGLHYPTWARELPMTEHYQEAVRSVRQFWLRLLKEFGGADKLPADLEFDPAPDMEPQVAQLIPRNMAQLKRIMEKSAGPAPSETLQQTLAEEMLTEPRTVDWIRENGMCIEHLIPGKSTLPQAGQGGFAQHHIRKGEMIVPAPLLQISDRAALTIYGDNGEPTGTQLLLNYCFGHKDTSMLLCPDVSNAILINHCSDRTKECGPEGPNAKFQWASGWDPDTPTWLNMTVDDIAKEEGRGLSLEIVALRDIAPGEEVFFDYGIEWETAWKKHVETWKAPEDGDYVSVKEINKDPHGLDLFVSHDLRSEVEHPHLFTACFFHPTELDEHEVWQTPEGSIDFEQIPDEEMLERFSDDGSMYVQDYLSHHDGAYWPCALLFEEVEEESTTDQAEGTEKKDADEGAATTEKKPPATYTVRIIQRDSTEYGDMPWMVNALPRFLHGFPRESIRIFPKPYSSDQHLKGAFRHHIPLRDDMVPNAWKNMKKDGVWQTQKRIVRRVPLSPREAAAQATQEEYEDYAE